jgi:hypothetical protein
MGKSYQLFMATKEPFHETTLWVLKITYYQKHQNFLYS